MSISKTTSRSRSNRPNPNFVITNTNRSKGRHPLPHCQANGVSLKALIKANPQITNPNLIKPGQDVHIPQSSASVVPSKGQAPSPSSSKATPRSAAWAKASNIAQDALRQIQMPNFQPQSIDQVRNGEARLIRGSRGPAVQDLQALLNQSGANLAEDGIFGPKTEAALLRYQNTRGASRTPELPGPPP